jgi:glycosyltransferase involved in cell wall biosynthesis
VRIVHINTADNDGGAARAAFRLHTGLLEAGHDSHMLVGYRVEANRPDISALRPSTLSRRALRRLIGEVERLTGLQYMLLPWGRQILEHPSLEKADVIHLHNLHGGFFPTRILPRLSRLAPLVWSVCDFWLMTGHCSYPSFVGCERWRTGCGQCPDLADFPAISVDTTRLLWRRKKILYSHCSGTVVAKSRWAFNLLTESPLLAGFEKAYIPNGYKTDVFRPVPRSIARQALAIPEDALTVFLGAYDLSGPRKGAVYMLEALEQVKADFPTLTLLAAGKDSDHLTAAFRNMKAHPLGILRSDPLLATCYSASDVTVLPTLADNSPNVMFESLSCGVPVVAFNVGGVPDAVRHMQTGYLAQLRDAHDLARGLSLLLSDGELRKQLGANARAMIVEEFSLQKQVGRFLDLYSETRERWSKSHSTVAVADLQECTQATVRDVG